MKLKNKTYFLRGFTLIELLIVVLIIGILAAVALPQYQMAVMKSRYTAMIPLAKKIADGNEVYYMEHGVYASSPARLDVAGQNGTHTDGIKLDLIDSADYSYVLASNETALPNNRYVVYQAHSRNFASNTHCEALTENTAAKKLCQNLGGVELGRDGDYTAYRMSGSSVGEFPPNFTQSCSGTTCTYTYDSGRVITDYASSGSFGSPTGREAFASRVYVTDPNSTMEGETFLFDENGNVTYMQTFALINNYGQPVGSPGFAAKYAADGTPILYSDSQSVKLPGAGGIHGDNWILRSLEFYEDGSIKEVTGQFNNDRIYFSYLPGGVPADSDTPAFESFNLAQTFQYEENLAYFQEVTSKTKCEMFPDLDSCK